MTEGLPIGVDELDGDPRLLIGWRTRSTLHGRRLHVHEDTHQVLRDIAAACLNHIHADDTEIRDYQSFSALESNQVFRVRSDEASTVDLDSASLVKMVQDSHAQELLDASELAEHHYAFYAIVWGGPNSNQVGFVRKQRQSDPGEGAEVLPLPGHAEVHCRARSRTRQRGRSRGSRLHDLHAQ